MTIKGYIYLLKVGDTKNRIIYKVGKSINFYKRYKEYNYAEILTFIISDDIDNDELEIIKLFNINCKLDTGREFFTAQSDLFVLNLFLTYFKNKNEINLSVEQNNNTDTNTNINTDTNIDTNTNTDTNTDINTDTNININTDTDTNTNTNTNINIENSEINSKILNKTCPNCNKLFQFPSRLKDHLKNTIHCNKTDNDIKLFFKKYNKNNTEKFKCEICYVNFSTLHNLNRHCKNSKCNKFIKQKNLLNSIETLKLEINNLQI